MDQNLPIAGSPIAEAAPDADRAIRESEVRRMGPFQWDDALLLEDQLTEDERAVRDAAREFCQEQLMPGVLQANRHERFDREIMNELRRDGLPRRHAGQPWLRRRRLRRPTA